MVISLRQSLVYNQSTDLNSCIECCYSQIERISRVLRQIPLLNPDDLPEKCIIFCSFNGKIKHEIASKICTSDFNFSAVLK